MNISILDSIGEKVLFLVRSLFVFVGSVFTYDL